MQVYSNAKYNTAALVILHRLYDSVVSWVPRRAREHRKQQLVTVTVTQITIAQLTLLLPQARGPLQN